MNGLIGMGATVALLLGVGGLIGLADRRRFAPGWLLAAALLVAVEDALLTRGYGLLPNLLPGDYNWQGKLLAFAAILAIAALPAFGWRRVGLTLRQAPSSLGSAAPVALAYCAALAGLALLFPNGEATGEDLAFQLTMPGLEEEAFYRGVLLYALDRAFAGRVRLLGVDWGWGAILSSLLFGLTHAFGYGRGGFSLEPMVMALTAIPSLAAVWVRYRTGSIALPVAMHNFGNTAMLVL